MTPEQAQPGDVDRRPTVDLADGLRHDSGRLLPPSSPAGQVVRLIHEPRDRHKGSAPRRLSQPAPDLGEGTDRQLGRTEREHLTECGRALTRVTAAGMQVQDDGNRGPSQSPGGRQVTELLQALSRRSTT